MSKKYISYMVNILLLLLLCICIYFKQTNKQCFTILIFCLSLSLFSFLFYTTYATLIFTLQTIRHYRIQFAMSIKLFFNHHVLLNHFDYLLNFQYVFISSMIIVSSIVVFI
eukprot:UN01373